MSELPFKLLLFLKDCALKEHLTGNISWEAAGYAVYEANTSEQARAVLETEEIAVLVTDQDVVAGVGRRLLRQARRGNVELKVIAVFDYTELELAEKALRLGIDECLLKPLHTQNCLECVNRVRRKIEEEQAEQQEKLRLLREAAKEAQKTGFSAPSRWILDSRFLKAQWSSIQRGELKKVLKFGSEKEVGKVLNEILKDFRKYKIDSGQYIMLLNSVILATFAVSVDLGFGCDEVLAIMGQQAGLFSLQSSEVEKWLRAVLLAVHAALHQGKTDPYENLIGEVKEYIQQNYAQGISLNCLASRFNLSISHLSRLFKEQAGESYMSYLNKIRINKAKELLAASNKKIYEIASAVGFNDAYYFSSWFKKVAGEPPSKYRSKA